MQVKHSLTFSVGSHVCRLQLANPHEVREPPITDWLTVATHGLTTWVLQWSGPPSLWRIQKRPRKSPSESYDRLRRKIVGNFRLREAQPNAEYQSTFKPNTRTLGPRSWQISGKNVSLLKYLRFRSGYVWFLRQHRLSKVKRSRVVVVVVHFNVSPSGLCFPFYVCKV